jgi:outer membrane protein TolC
MHLELGVSPEQWKQIQPGLVRFQEAAKKHREVIQELRGQMRARLAAPESDRAAIRAKQEEILAAQRAMQKLVIGHFLREKELRMVYERMNSFCRVGTGVERARAALGCILALAFSGCATLDPWHTSEKAPPAPSSSYIPPARVATSPPLPAKAHEELPGHELSLAECIGIALERNPATRVSWQAAKAAAARTGEQRAAYLPSVSVEAGVGHGKSATPEPTSGTEDRPISGSSIFQAILSAPDVSSAVSNLASSAVNQAVGQTLDTALYGSPDTGPTNTSNVLFGVRYLLFDGGVRAAAVAGAEADLLAADFQHNATLQDMALTVEEAYYGLLAYKEFTRVAEQTVEQTQYHVDVAQGRHAAGVATRADVLRAQTERANAQLGLVRAQSAVRIAQGRLTEAMGLRVTTPFAVSVLPQDVHAEELAQIEDLLQEAAAHRPELQAAWTRVEASRAAVKGAKARYWPTVTAEAQYGWRDWDSTPDREDWSVGIGVTVPVFDGFARDYALRRTEADVARAQAEEEQVLRGVEFEVWVAHSRLEEAGQAIDAAQAQVASAEEAARLTEGQYRNGMATIAELIDAQSARTAAQVHLVQARLDWYTALAQTERAIGRTLAGGTPGEAQR